MKSPGSKFLHNQNPKLHATPAVEHTATYLRAHGEQLPNQPADKIEAYIGFLANPDYVNDGILTGDQISIDRQIEAKVIKEEDVSESYFELQRRINRERGLGDVEIGPAFRHRLVEAAQSDQRAGLKNWVEYLGGDDGGYPDWFKLYTWDSVTKLGTFDKGKHQFQRRSRGTMAAYPELNREALAYVYDKLSKAQTQDKKINKDEQLQELISSGNFGKLYAHALFKVTPDSPELKKNTEGSWKKFDQSDDPRTARRLAESLQGHGTGWCTAGGTTAQTQLKDGDFYVYYTKDRENKDSVPRVAIRMENGEVAEVRGVGDSQELEPIMNEITEEKLNTLPGGDTYKQKLEDMKIITDLERRVNENPEVLLTTEELLLLYQIEGVTTGFGYGSESGLLSDRDARLEGMKMLRDRDADLQRIIKEQPEAITNATDLDLDGLTNAEGLIFDGYYGDLRMNTLAHIEGFSMPAYTDYSLEMAGLITAKDTTFPESVGWDLDLRSLTSIENTVLPKHVEHDLVLSSLASAEGVELPQVGGMIYIDDANVRDELINRYPQYASKIK